MTRSWVVGACKNCPMELRVYCVEQLPRASASPSSTTMTVLPSSAKARPLHATRSRVGWRLYARPSGQSVSVSALLPDFDPQTHLVQLQQGCQSLGITLDRHQLAQFELYYRELVEWNEKFNLTAIIDYREVQTKHFLD